MRPPLEQPSRKTLYMRAWRARHPENGHYHKEYMRAYLADPDNAERARERARLWVSANPGRIKERNRRRYDAKRELIQAQHRAWKEANPERYRAMQRMNASLRRSARNGTAVTLDQVIGKYGWVCGICGSSIEGAFHVDHIQPIARGGRHELSNLQLAHPRCNQRKGSSMGGLL